MRTNSLAAPIGRSVFSYALTFAVLLTASLPSLISLAAIKTWTDGTGPWDVPENWSPKGVPVSSDSVQVNNGGTAQLTDSATVSFFTLGTTTSSSGTLQVLLGSQLTTPGGGTIGSGSASTGTMTVQDGSKWFNPGGMIVGSEGTGSLQVKSGGELTRTASGSFAEDSFIVGYQPGSTGNVLVDSATLITSGGRGMIVGYSGTGSMTIQGGGQVSSSGSGSTGLELGRFAGSQNNSVVVDGAGSKFTTAGSVMVGGSGTGTLDITNGGLVSDSFGNISAGSSATVQTAGAWNNSGFLFVSGALHLLNNGKVSSNQFNVTGGTVDMTYSDLIATDKLSLSSGGTVTRAALPQASPGRIIISSDPNSAPPGSSQVYVGTSSGKGILDMQSGSKLDLSGADSSANPDGVIDGLQGTLATVSGTSPSGTRSQWTGIGELTIGGDKNGELKVLSGGFVDSDDLAHIGRNAGSLGQLTVSGKSASGQRSEFHAYSIFVGNTGTGFLTISGEGKVTCQTAAVGNSLSPIELGTATVDGKGSEWSIGYQLNVGQLGDGSLKIQNGGKVQITNVLQQNARVLIGSSQNGFSPGVITVDGIQNGTQSSLIVNGDLSVGFAGLGTLNIKNQGRVESLNSTIGDLTGANGTVIVDNATWLSNGTVHVGGGATGLLDIRTGGEVTATGGFDLYAGGKIMGTGTYIGEVRNHEGTTSPANSPGTLHINGNYTQESGGKLQIELASNSIYDILDVTGAASLGGTLELSFLNGYVPAPTDTFNILATGARSGTFNNVVVNTGSGPGTFNINYTPTGIALSNYQPPSNFVIRTRVQVRASSSYDESTYDESNLIDAVITEASINTSAMNISGSSTSNFGDSWAGAHANTNGVLVLDMGSSLTLDGLLYAQRTEWGNSLDDFGSASVWITNTDPGSATLTLPGTLGDPDAVFDLMVDDINGATLRRYDFPASQSGRFAVIYFTNPDAAPYVPGGQELRLFTESASIGDFNHDGNVDAADYVAWRLNDGSPQGYALWRAHFGQSNLSGTNVTATAIPEPTHITLLVIAFLLGATRRLAAAERGAATTRTSALEV